MGLKGVDRERREWGKGRSWWGPVEGSVVGRMGSTYLLLLSPSLPLFLLLTFYLTQSSTRKRVSEFPPPVPSIFISALNVLDSPQTVRGQPRGKGTPWGLPRSGEGKLHDTRGKTSYMLSDVLYCM